jgi:hypothetical protein
MRLLFVPFVALLGACSAALPPPSSGKARYDAYPETLLAAFRSACTGRAQSFVRPSDGIAECREFLPPEATAAIILSFDGTAEDLPELVIRFETLADSEGYLVSNDVFLNVPQKSGDPLQVRQTDPRLTRAFDALYQRTGGTLQ